MCQKFFLVDEQWVCIAVLGFEEKKRRGNWKNKNILKHIPSMMKKRWVVRSCHPSQCKCESTKIIWNIDKHKKMRKKETHKEEEGSKEGPTSFKDALLYYSLLAKNKNR